MSQTHGIATHNLLGPLARRCRLPASPPKQRQDVIAYLAQLAQGDTTK